MRRSVERLTWLPERQMASTTAVNAKNLELLGVKRLAEILAELSEADTATKRRLRIELAAKHHPGEVGREVRRRLVALAKSRSFVDWQGVRALASDLELQRATIANQVAMIDAGEALDLMWRFLGLAQTVYERCDDSN